MEELNSKNLIGLAAEKHERFIKGYRGELEKAERIILLEDKLSQLEHWIKQNPNNKGEYVKRKLEASRELDGLKKSLGKHSRIQDYRRSLTKRIVEHEAALDYWRGRKVG